MPRKDGEEPVGVGQNTGMIYARQAIEAPEAEITIERRQDDDERGRTASREMLPNPSTKPGSPG